MTPENLAALTTLGVGGPAWGIQDVPTVDDLRRALARADSGARPSWILGGGSNVLVSDEGFHGLVIRPADTRIEAREDGSGRVRAAAGVGWDDLVARCVERGWAGIECLSGIPGHVGAAPIQNIGAYGQELSERLESVEVLDRTRDVVEVLDRDACGFGYRTSRFKAEDRGRYAVLFVTLRLDPGGPPTLRYPELTQHLAGKQPDLRTTRDAVLQIRARKSMVFDPSDPNHRSAGSFFTNPIVDPADADEVAQRAQRLGHGLPPRYAAPDGRAKLSAAWLIEKSGFGKGWGDGAAGLSTNHCLAIVNRGGATAQDILRVAGTVRRGVADTFGVTLVPEPVFVGFDDPVDVLLERALNPSK